MSISLKASSIPQSPVRNHRIQQKRQVFLGSYLDYINQMLLEEDMDYDMLQTHPYLKATEKPFYESAIPSFA
ncbi:hypothetical protein KSP40_PGU010020 [Platanthera guangdongensis]|uniref:Uncharacterized protein n=1 Tax=Platanthera guangdongensis TaxID=2320717 RepID=A0ABR2MQ32_9ASPA